MKKSLQILSAIAFVFGLSSSANAQWESSSAESSASAQIVTPISLQNLWGINFGVMAKPSEAGTVIVDAATGQVTASAGIVHFGGNFHGELEVTGEDNAVYNVTAPASATLTNANGATMTVDGFSTYLLSAGAYVTQGTLNNNPGQDRVLTGATLHVGANQESGVYSGTYTFTATYN